VQGRLRREKLTVRIDTACGCCGRRLRLTADEELRFAVESRGAEPLLFEPHVDWGAFRGRDIRRVY
jgi:hypothetical protein